MTRESECELIVSKNIGNIKKGIEDRKALHPNFIIRTKIKGRLKLVHELIAGTRCKIMRRIHNNDILLCGICRHHLYFFKTFIFVAFILYEREKNRLTA